MPKRATLYYYNVWESRGLNLHQAVHPISRVKKRNSTSLQIAAKLLRSATSTNVIVLGPINRHIDYCPARSRACSSEKNRRNHSSPGLWTHIAGASGPKPSPSRTPYLPCEKRQCNEPTDSNKATFSYENHRQMRGPINRHIDYCPARSNAFSSVTSMKKQYSRTRQKVMNRRPNHREFEHTSSSNLPTYAGNRGLTFIKPDTLSLYMQVNEFRLRGF